MAPAPAFSPRKRPVQRRAQTTVEDILRAAAQVFSRHGYAAGTTNRIAERAGISIGSLYQYFPNKDAILVALVEQHITQSTTRLFEVLYEAQARGLQLEALLRRMVEEMVALHAGNPRLHRVLFEEAPRPPALRRVLHEAEQRLAEGATALLKASPEVTVRNPAAAAYLVVQLVEGLTHQFVLHPPEALDTRTFSDELVTLVHAYLTARPRRPGTAVQ
jgi:AcrR family transcriptional regulator